MVVDVGAVEASEMAEYARKLTAGNPLLAQRIMVVKGKVEEVELPEKADILISGPMAYAWTQVKIGKDIYGDIFSEYQHVAKVTPKCQPRCHVSWSSRRDRLG
ncbi:hypothetical protein HYC85_019105 [Camellia sinensis]|uniref:type I protein arginine methyltransferase n=1 Tax=Camellia sinensis TaxID=4442 RepID=A0A7J7GKX7_CAMSI|nr:hypothetical protein HYC85_019105 [Camellia sinensis]